MLFKTHVLLKKELIAHLSALSSTEVKVYIAVLILANPKTGKLTIPLKDLAARVGLSYRIANHAVLRLKEMGHIRYYSDRTLKESHIEIANYVPITEPSSGPHPEPTSQFHEEPSSQPHDEQGSQSRCDQISVQNQPPHDAANIVPNAHGAQAVKPDTTVIVSPPTPPVQPEPKAALIERIASTFNDRQKLGFYQSFCEPVSVAIIQRAFAEAKSVPESRIKHSRRSLFVYLVQKYAQP